LLGAGPAEIAVIGEHAAGARRVPLVEQQLERFLATYHVGSAQLSGERLAFRLEGTPSFTTLGRYLRAALATCISLVLDPCESVARSRHRLLGSTQLARQPVALGSVARDLGAHAVDLTADLLEIRLRLGMIGALARRRRRSSRRQQRGEQRDGHVARGVQVDDIPGFHARLGSVAQGAAPAWNGYTRGPFLKGIRLPMDRLLEYAANHPWLVSAAVLTAVLVLVFELRLRQTEFAAISAQDAIRLMNQGALVLDLRPEDAFNAGHLGGARRMDSADILKAGESLKKYKDKPVVVYCDSGALGASAARELARQGFTKAVNLRGGIAAWRAEGLPLAKGSMRRGDSQGKRA
jgi:rhodanese-related sulfurtransferase